MVAVRKQQAEPEVLDAARPRNITDLSLARALGSTASTSLYRRGGKRVFDIVAAGLLFFLCLPLMLAVALAVLVTSGWPVLYASERVGLGGGPFRMWKFRTMVQDADRVLHRWRELRPDLAAEYGENFKLRDDPRITSLGRLLRKTSLDELPQLWNVLHGDMSFVGPRPVPESELAVKYGASSNEVLSVRPGITGMWQVNGRSSTSYPERVRYDRTYALNVSLVQDLRIVVKTFVAVLRVRDAA